MASGPTLKMSAEIAQKIRQHGAETYPHECCGALLGRDAALAEGTATAGGVQLPSREIVAGFPLLNRRGRSPPRFVFSCAQRVTRPRPDRPPKGAGIWGVWSLLTPGHPC